MSELTFKEIWETLYAVDVSKHTEKKMQFTYLSWARGWTLMMESFPQAKYNFIDFDGVPYRLLADGTAEVMTSIKIDEHERSMILPIMDNKNNAVVNPNSRQVNDNRQRCLVKNMAMIGLGMSVFSQWDDHLPSEEKDVQPKGKKPLPKEEPKKEEVEEVDDTYTLKWANTFVDAFEKVITFQDSREDLVNRWKEKTSEIGMLETKFPEQKNRLDKIFKTRSSEINEKSNQSQTTEE
jgi:hypothetical protein